MKRLENIYIYIYIFRNNIPNNRYCTCGDEEIVFHFFFECRNYTDARDILIY